MDKADLTFVDINRDGLMDAVVNRNFNSFLFMNQGKVFSYARSSSMLERPLHSQYPRLLNVSGTADDQLTMFGNKMGLIAFDLNEAATGLLSKVDNGQGVILDFSYQWTKPIVGVPRPFIVPASLTVTTSGYSSQVNSFAFFEPKVNPVNAELIGFGRVETTGPQLFTYTNFLTDIFHQPKVLESVKQDLRVGHILDVESNKWQKNTLDGVNYPKLLQTVSSYMQNKIPTLRHTIDFQEYDRLCPTKMKKTTNSGILQNLLGYFISPLWRQHHPCLVNNDTLVAQHNKNTLLDFSYTTATDRNAAGQAIDIFYWASDKNLSQTKFTYDDAANLKSVTQANLGKTFLHYDPVYEILSSLQHADGTVQEVTGYASQADSIVSMTTRRGDDADFEQEFAFDGWYRLHKAWNNLAVSSIAEPLNEYGYRLGNTTFPSVVTSYSQTDSGVYAQSASITDADGQELTTVKTYDAGWHFAKLTRLIPSNGQVHEVNLDYLHKNPHDVSFLELNAANQTLSETSTSQLWGMLNRTTTVTEDKQNHFSRNIEIDSQGVKVVSLENNQFTTKTSLDLPMAKTSSHFDEAGRAYEFERDLLGRLRKITLPGSILVSCLKTQTRLRLLNSYLVLTVLN